MNDVQAAAKVTETVVASFNRAQESLRTCFVNGAGVLSDPSETRRDLLEAKSAIDGALAALNSVTHWPDDEAYE